MPKTSVVANEHSALAVLILAGGAFLLYNVARSGGGLFSGLGRALFGNDVMDGGPGQRAGDAFWGANPGLASLLFGGAKVNEDATEPIFNETLGMTTAQVQALVSRYPTLYPEVVANLVAEHNLGGPVQWSPAALAAYNDIMGVR